MVDGMRDGFVENDVLGNTNAGTIGLLGGNNRRVKKTRSRRRAKRVSRRRSSKKAHHKMHRRRSKGGIKYTKKGQPYKIMPNGRARFIKKRK